MTPVPHGVISTSTGPAEPTEEVVEQETTDESDNTEED